MLVKKKLPSPVVVSWLLQVVEEAGHKCESMSIKSDQEESNMAVKKTVVARREEPTVPLESKARVSRTNPDIERAVRKWRGQFRKIRLEMESQVKENVDVMHPIVGWMITWASQVLLEYRDKENGRTA